MLEARDISVNYGPRVAVANVSLKLAPKQIMAVIGPNGAGKSTVLRALNGNTSVSNGQVLLDDRRLTDYSRRAIAKRIAVVAQEADLRFPVTVWEFVLGGRYAWASASGWGWETTRDIRVAESAMEETDLEELAERPMTELSGGERQRAVLARALATEATTLLLDEPTANLDLAHQATLLGLVRQRCDDRGLAALVITHDINLAAEFADQVLLMKNGTMVAFGRGPEVFTPELIRQIFSVEVLVDAHPVSGVPRITPVHRSGIL